MPNRRDPNAESWGTAHVSSGSRDVPSERPDPASDPPPQSPGTPSLGPVGLESVSWELPHTFLGLWGEEAAFESSQAVILPVPYESTTSYSGGARNGPRAIVEASRYVEVYDQELDTDLTGIGVHTFPAVELTRAGSTEAMTELHEVYGRLLDAIGDRFPVIWAEEMWEDDAWIDRAVERIGDPVYLTFDVDDFDPSLMPSTGTPEPGGGDWYRTLRFLHRVFRERRVVGMDVVELAPTPGLHAPDFLVAKLVAKLLAYRFLAGT